MLTRTITQERLIDILNTLNPNLIDFRKDIFAKFYDNKNKMELKVIIGVNTYIIKELSNQRNKCFAKLDKFLSINTHLKLNLLQ